MILTSIDEHFQSEGWTVASLQFDGLLVEHRPGADLDAAMRGAEHAARERLGYAIKLKEKPLFEVDASETFDELEAGDDEETPEK